VLSIEPIYLLVENDSNSATSRLNLPKPDFAGTTGLFPGYPSSTSGQRQAQMGSGVWARPVGQQCLYRLSNNKNRADSQVLPILPTAA
jgi:hypothetical protein